MSDGRLGFGLAVIQMPVLPVQPSMSKFVGKNIAPSGHRQPLAKIDRFCGVVPDSVGIWISTVHIAVCKLAHRDSIAKRKDDS